jgi:hypothetical protein
MSRTATASNAIERLVIWAMKPMRAGPVSASPRPARALAKGTDGAQADTPSPAMRKRIRVARRSGCPGAVGVHVQCDIIHKCGSYCQSRDLRSNTRAGRMGTFTQIVRGKTRTITMPLSPIHTWRSGCASTIHRATSSATAPTERSHVEAELHMTGIITQPAYGQCGGKQSNLPAV